MDIVLKRSFPWFPVVLAAGWMLMTILTVRDLAGFAVNAPGPDTVATTAEAASSTTTVKMPIGLTTPCTAAAIAPVSSLIH